MNQKVNKTRVGILTVVFGTIFLLVFKYTYTQVPLSKVAAFLTGIAIILALVVDFAIAKINGGRNVRKHN